MPTALAPPPASPSAAEPAAGEAALRLRNLRKSYGDLTAVADVSLEVAPGEIFGLLGPNGAGKSTTMMIACGVLPADGGTVELSGEILSPDRRDLRRRLGVVPQDLAIYPELTARQNLRFFGRLYGLGGTELNDRVADALERTGLTNRADDRAEHYSGGMKRRLNFGCALLHRPSVLILDEPTVGVDPQSRAHLLSSVKDVAAEGAAVVYASHYMEEVEEICDRVAVIDAGRVLAAGTIPDLLAPLESVLRLHVTPPPGDPDGATLLPPAFAGLFDVVAQPSGVLTYALPRSRLNRDTTLSGVLAPVLEHVKGAGGRLDAVHTDEPDLERLFLKLTGNTLRD
ncbi:ABC transporter ATP-binding protein [Alienimonas californiensis]|uniref:Putative ABC transporter ATP-binding protein YbhF n=1 Tax=Alienimonas californiensis TaxID=2527989 RepID=A0A517PFN2_9PLAN|nr:ABC transporter ATP-binding protein [Alienimonas californiensis]QDT18169.1 putative ABC transporter ATP-binding protein YbhF [Alienimonas californiensis]